MRIDIKLVLCSLAVHLCGSAAQAQSSSPFTPPEEALGTYVISAGAGLDTGCTYRGGGPLRISVPIPKVVSDKQLNADGTLIDSGKLVANGVLSAQATIRFPVFDIDDKAATEGTYSPEVDRVSFNGRFKKTLEGFNQTWTDDSLLVPIEEIKFGQDNNLEIDIDTANSDAEYWCMAVDWVSIEFDVTPPYILQHGIAANQSTWEEATAPGVLRALDERGVLHTRFSLGAGNGGNASVAANAIELNRQITAFLKPLKADKVHVIAHSKGGLDTQAMQALAPEFTIMSLSTLSTPHLGSVAADLSIIQKQSANDKINSGADPQGFAAAYVNTWTFGQGPQLPGLADLTTYAATAALSTGQRNNIPKTYTIGANADLNHDNDLTSNESAPLFPSAAHYAAERAWRVLRDFSSANMTLTTVPGGIFGSRTVLTYNTVVATAPQANDIVVTEGSANPGYGFPINNVDANHSTVKSGANIDTILDTTLPRK
jgi:pimeloyl-ACP methyl ester carboxylesterase